MNYSPELKDALLRRILPPNNESITKISREEGISEQTLRNWRDKARKEGYAAPGTDAVPDDWSTQDKFLVVVETASMNETELAEYDRKKGLPSREEGADKILDYYRASKGAFLCIQKNKRILHYGYIIKQSL